MKKLTKIILTVAAAALTACGGGGGGGSTSTGGTYFTHDQLASEFVRRVNTDVSGYNLTLVKSDTLQYDYIVVYDNYYGTYDAYYIGNYSVGQDLSSYLYNNQSYFYYGLNNDGSGIYTDPVTGVQFEKDEESSKNLESLEAAAQQVVLAHSAKTLQDQYGMSESKSLDVAKIAFQINNSPKGSLNVSDYDAFAKQITGSTITEIQAAMKSGDQAAINDKIDLASQVTGMGPENTQKLLSSLAK